MSQCIQILFCAFCAITVQASAAESRTDRTGRLPNVVLIYIDDLGYGDIGCYGCRDIPTPHIDRLAAEGVRFTASYITNPPCCPSRCGLMMGQYAQRFGKYGMSRGLPIPEDRPTRSVGKDARTAWHNSGDSCPSIGCPHRSRLDACTLEQQ